MKAAIRIALSAALMGTGTVALAQTTASSNNSAAPASPATHAPAAASAALPLSTDIMKIMQPLEYSGFPAMARPGVSLGLDFNKRVWILKNIHTYDKQGGVILEQGRFGLCAELATYLYAQLKPKLTPRYGVKFAMVSESGFFTQARANHIVLLILDQVDRQLYLADPSFHVYGRLKDLPDYQVLNTQDTLSFVKDQSPDVSFSVDQATPLYIKGDFLLSFAVTSVDGRFDKDNFIFVISAQRRYKDSVKDIVMIGRRKGEFMDIQDKAILTGLLTEQEVNTLFARLQTWIEQIGK